VKVQNFSACSYRWYLLNQWTFWNQTWYGDVSYILIHGHAWSNRCSVVAGGQTNGTNIFTEAHPQWPSRKLHHHLAPLSINLLIFRWISSQCFSDIHRRDWISMWQQLLSYFEINTQSNVKVLFRPWSTIRPSRTIQSVATVTQWNGPMKSRIVYEFLPSHTTEYDGGSPPPTIKTPNCQNGNLTTHPRAEKERRLRGLFLSAALYLRPWAHGRWRLSRH